MEGYNVFLLQTKHQKNTMLHTLVINGFTCFWNVDSILHRVDTIWMLDNRKALLARMACGFLSFMNESTPSSYPANVPIQVVEFLDFLPAINKISCYPISLLRLTQVIYILWTQYLLFYSFFIGIISIFTYVWQGKF